MHSYMGEILNVCFPEGKRYFIPQSRYRMAARFNHYMGEIMDLELI
jgi:hypothetical protein